MHRKLIRSITVFFCAFCRLNGAVGESFTLINVLFFAGILSNRPTICVDDGQNVVQQRRC